MNIDNLKKARGLVRRAATDTIKLLEIELERKEKSSELIEELLAKLTDKEASLGKYNCDILNLCKLEEIEKEVEKQHEYQDNIIVWKIRANKFLRNFENQHLNTSQVSTLEGSVRVDQLDSVKLPRLQIPQFDGNILKFNEFYSQFEVAIDKNLSLSNVQKLSYLKSYLINDAEIAIRGLALSSENYTVALNILKERFGRKDIIVDAHMSKLLNLSPVRKSNDIVALRRLYSECETHIRGLENNAIDTKSYSCLFFSVLLKCIPRELSLEFTRRTQSKDSSDVSDLLVFLKNEIQCRERNEYLFNEYGSRESEIKKESKFNYDKPIKRYGRYDKFKVDYSRKTKSNTDIPNTSAFVIDVKKCVFCNNPEIKHDSVSCPLTVEQRKASLRRFGLCYSCLGRSHIYKTCQRRTVCTKCNKRFHSELICDTNLVNPSRPIDNSEVQKGQESPPVLTSKIVTTTLDNDCDILLETCSATLMSDSQAKEINILLDNASQRCFLKSDIAKEMNLPVLRQETLSVYTFGCRDPIRKTYDIVELTLCNSHEPKKKITIEALLTDFISSSTFKVSQSKLQRVLKNKNIHLANVSKSAGNELSLLIGAQYFWEIHSGKKKRVNKTLFLIDTLFGKVIQGRLSPLDLSYKRSVSTMKIECCAALNESIKRFWELDSLGLNEAGNESLNLNEEFIAQFERNLNFKNGRYETKLFWDEKPDNLDNNFAIAKKRFDRLTDKMRENSWVYDEYKKIVKEQLISNIVEECSSSCVQNSFYMPHSAVVREDRETTKVRMVFDASSKGKGCKSLNDCLYSGPALNPTVLDVILSFREHEIAFSADIQGAFLTIGIAREDRDYLRFLWFPYRGDPGPYKIMRMNRVPFGVASSSFILAATIKHHIRKYKIERRETFEMLDSNLYIDDLYHGAGSVDKALEHSIGAVEILKDASMNLRKFKTNSKELRNLWFERGMTEAREADDERPLKVLGLIWDIEDDIFKLEVQSLLDMRTKLKDTKRSVLQVASKIFDPVGIASPFVVVIKLIMQEIWENGLGWDDELPAELKKKWEIWCSQISLLKNLKFERKYFSVPLTTIKELELHIFSDASPRAFGAVAYFRYVVSDDYIRTCFVMAKSRIAPLKRLTLPRLELMGAVIASRIFRCLKSKFKFPFSGLYFWTDSLITLHWVKGQASRWKNFVANRVTEIQSLTDPLFWHHCSGKDNPADYLTRGETVEKLIASPEWLEGPNWLRLKKEAWLQSSYVSYSEPCDEIEFDYISSFVCEVSKLTQVLDLTKYSDLRKLYRITGWVLRFIYNTRNKLHRREELSAEEIDGAEIIWIKTVQQEVFAQELSCLKQGKPVSRTSSILELNPFLDENGVMRISGRLQKSKLTYLLKHPIILPSGHLFVRLLVWDAHDKVFHGGISETLMELRERFWLLKGRQTVKFILKKCKICKRFNAPPGTQITAPLPNFRVEQTPPFSVVGIDFGGPLYARGSDEKNYIVLFTCSITRAIHLEFVGNLTAETFLLSLRRFIARRGLCSEIVTDNAKTFKRSELELKNLWTSLNNPVVKNFYASHKIRWRYIAEKAAWWGGFYERLIKSVKLALRKTLGKTTLFREELETLIIEIEGVLNSRPLTYVYSEFQEPVPLTPAHMLLGRRVNSLPPARLNFDSNLSTRKFLIKRFNYRERLINMFWMKWKKEYLLLLKSMHCIKPTGKITEFKTGDIVLINDDKLPRHFWKLGRVLSVFPGRDGKIRSCEIKTDASIIRRPVQLLYNLEIND